MRLYLTFSWYMFRCLLVSNVAQSWKSARFCRRFACKSCRCHMSFQNWSSSKLKLSPNKNLLSFATMYSFPHTWHGSRPAHMTGCLFSFPCTSRIHIHPILLNSYTSLTAVFRDQAGSLCVPFVVERFVPLKGWLLKRRRRAHSFVWASSIDNMTSGKLTEALEVFDKEENGSANRTQGWNNTGRVTRLSPPPMRPDYMFSLRFIHFSDQPNTSLSKQTLLLSHTHTSSSTITTPICLPGFCVQYKLSVILRFASNH